MPSFTSTSANPQTTPKTIPLTSYLFTRLTQLGCTSLHGVPGDYNLTALDHLNSPTNPSAPLYWVGNCNELNAGYAADGYGRIKGLGALITAFGVGELSAINAIGGAYAERAPVVHIVGTPPRAAQSRGVCLHHSFGDGDFRVFARMATSVTVAQADLVDEGTACEEIDRVLRECVIQSRPVYLELPTDMVNIPVPSDRLSTPIDCTTNTSSPCQEDREDEVVQRLLARITRASQPFIIVDGFCARYNIFPEIEQLVKTLGWPTTSTPFGKSCIDETLSNFHGIYAGLAGRSMYKPWVESCDLVLRFGGLDSDVNTYGFSTLPPEKATVNFQRESVTFGDDGGRRIEGLPIKSLLQTLLQRLTDLDGKGKATGIPRMDPYPSHLGDPRKELADLSPAKPKSAIQQHDFWRRISHFFREGDVILTETGTPSVGSREFVLPRHARLINSSIWLSIGYMLAAAQGASLAIREIREEGEAKGKMQPNGLTNGNMDTTTTTRPASVLSPSTASGRTILFEGDGSFQMTAQELSTIIRHRLDLTLFLINNDGYTIERFIHGMRAHYNDVARWRYLDAPGFFGAATATTNTTAHDEEGDAKSSLENGAGSRLPPASPASSSCRDSKDSKDGKHGTEYPIQTHQARTWGELSHVLGTDAVRAGKGLCMIEVFMDREDAPESLKKLVRNVQRRNSGGEEEKDGGDGGDGEDWERERERERGKLVEEKFVKAAG
jgi:pyruvate decarboxylase